MSEPARNDVAIGEDEAEDGVDVAEDRGDDEGLGLELIDPLPLVHLAIVADPAAPRRDRLPRAELAARGGDVGAPVAAHGGGDPVRAQPVGERPESTAWRWRAPPNPAVGLSGIRFTCAPPAPGNAAEQPAERLGLRRRVVHAGDAGVLERDPPALGAGELGGGVEHLGDRVAPVERDELARARRRSPRAATPRA